MLSQVACRFIACQTPSLAARALAGASTCTCSISATFGASTSEATGSQLASCTGFSQLRHKHSHHHHDPKHPAWRPPPASAPQPLPPGSESAPGEGPAAKYWAGRATGVYRPDPRQEVTIAMLQTLYEELRAAGPRIGRSRPRNRPASGLTMLDTLDDHSSSSSKGGGFWSGLTSLVSGGGSSSSESSSSSHSSPGSGHTRGLYMYGGVGCGKTMLMDLFVATAPPEFEVTRTHFHDFMLDVHAKLRTFKGDADPLLRVADATAKHTRVLALDEFFVTDVADAMILARLFARLWDRGVVLVATSNRHPDKLYENGLQRALFMPFIHRLKAECATHDMASTTDYRRLAQHTRGLYFTSPSRDADLSDEFSESGGEGAGAPAPAVIDVRMGRHMDVPLATGKAALFGFADLCGRPVAAADYIAITERFHTLAVSGVPVFGPANKTEAYRFVTLIDVMYEHRVRMLIAADAPPFDLFEKVVTQADVAAKPALRDVPDIVVDDNLGFAKDRTISRLTEMQSLEYLIAHAKAHAPENLLALQEQQQKEAAKAAKAKHQ